MTEKIPKPADAASHSASTAAEAWHLSRIMSEFVEATERLAGEKMIDPEDMDLIRVIDEPQAIVDAIFKHYEHRSFEPLPSEREVMLNL